MTDAPPSRSAGRAAAIGALVAVNVLLGAGVAATVPGLVGTIADAQPVTTETTVFDQLRPGDCILDFIWQPTYQAEYQVVDCSLPHGAEVIYRPSLGEAADVYPGEPASIAISKAVCDLVFDNDRYLDESVHDYPEAGLQSLWLTRRDWVDGQREYACFLLNQDGTPLVGSFYAPDLL